MHARNASSIGRRARPHAFLSVTHPLAGRRSIRTDELMEYPCIVYEQTADSPGFSPRR